MSRRLRRSHEPPFWLLFGAGGLLAALVLPAVVLFTGLIAPLSGRSGDAGLLEHARMLSLLSTPIARLACAGFIALLAWHACHRIYHLCHDLGLRGGAGLRWACYGTAALVSVIGLVLVMGLPHP